jgi:hypothetical protein
VVRIRTTALPTGGGARAPLDIIITGQADDNGGVTMSGSQVTFGPSASPRQYTGQLVSLNGTSMTAQVRDNAGQSLLLAIGLQPNGTSVTGTLQVTTARTTSAGGTSRSTRDGGE